MSNINILKGKMMENGLNQSQFAKLMGIDRSTLNRKLKTGEDFTVKEANQIVDILSLSYQEAVDIFFK